MKEFVDRASTYKGRKTITYEDGTQQTVTIENADEPVADGTPINRETFMAIQEYNNENVVFEANSIIKTNSNGEIETITFSDNQIIKEFVGEKTITQKITFTESGYTKELI